MTLIENHWEKEQAITPRAEVKLPASYLTLLAQQNGGYVTKMRVPTDEPTSDGLDFALLHYLFGLHDQQPYSIFHHQRADLPDYFIVFSANESQLFAFDYSEVDANEEPAIRYLDIETANWQTVAHNFSDLVARLEPQQMDIPLEGTLTRFEAEHALLLANEEKQVAQLLLHLEAVEQKAWYMDWIAYFAVSSDVNIRKAALQALETQVLFFRLQLPNNVRDILDVFLRDERAEIRDYAGEVLRELEDK